MSAEDDGGFAPEPPLGAGPDPDPVDTLLADVRRATEVIDPPPDFAARVLAATSRERRASGPSSGRRSPVVDAGASWWPQLGSAGRRVVPFAAVAAAAAMALAWSADARLDDAVVVAADLAQDLP